uniref:PC-esterase domain-containing protein 1B-like n=1 Tax=Jaculus jaculus TaxID=51337 RepID=UPI001E1B202A|nr:PC-esterase domain-containing protein 1B-like [Jaculus jaculus]
MPQLLAREVRQLLHNKFVVVLGDSVQRAVYKDLVLLLQRDCLLSSRQLKAKGEPSFERDVLLEGGRPHNGTRYREVRQFCTGHHLVRFYFLTRAYSRYVEGVLAQLRWGDYAPDLVVLNSCLWDLSRYRRDFRTSYPHDLQRLFARLHQVLPESCLVVWNTAMPVARVVTGGFLPPGDASGAAHLREDVMEANFYSSVEAARRGFDVLDLHFHFRHAGQHRLHDGVHWDRRVHRCLSQLLLAHVADAWGVLLPGRHPVGRWLRDVPPAAATVTEGRPGSARDGQAPHEPGDAREPAAPRSRTPPPPPARGRNRRSSSRGRNPPPPYSRDARPSPAPPVRRAAEYPADAGTVNPEQGPGPIRRASARHPQASPPYPPQRPREPPRLRGRPTAHRN